MLLLIIGGGESGVIEDDAAAGAVGGQFEVDDGVDAGGPGGAAPGLDDPFRGGQLDVAAYNAGSEEAEGSARVGVDFGGGVGKGAEEFGVEQNIVEAGGGGFE